MMFRFTILAILWRLTVCAAPPENIHARAREYFFLAGEQPCKAGQLLEITRADDSGRQVILAYQGAAYAMLADCGGSPFGKLKNFNRGKEIINGAVREDPANSEIRFIRFMVQDRAPAFLRYDDRNEDLSLMIETFRTSTGTRDRDEFLVKMAQAVLSSDFPDGGQKDIISGFINQ
jgi:hypothetical protein